MNNSAEKYRYQLVRMLLSAGADINYPGFYQKSVFTLDKKTDSEVQYKLREMYHPTIAATGPLVNHLINTTYYNLDAKKLEKWKKLLKKYKFNPNRKDRFGNTPLYYALKNTLETKKLNPMTVFLFKSGARCGIKNIKKVNSYKLVKKIADKKLRKKLQKLCLKNK